MLRRPSPLAVLLATSLLCGASTSYAQPTAASEAEQHLQRGVELANLQNHAAALAEYTRAYELSRNPELLYNLAVAHLTLGNFVESLDLFQRYLGEAPAGAVARRRPTLDATMARLRQLLGTLVIPFDIPGLTVRVDDVACEARRMREGLPVSSGRHRVALAAPGRQPREDVLDVAGGQRVEVTADLARIPGGMRVVCNVPDALVFVDGRGVGRTPLESRLAVDEGAHRIEVRRVGYTTYAAEVEVRGQEAVVDAELAWSPSIGAEVAARLIVVASEADAVATLDGRRVPLDGSEALPPGSHRLRVEHRDFLPMERPLTLDPGDTRVEHVVLVPTPAYRRDCLQRAEAARRTAWIVTGAGALALAGGALAAALITARVDELVEERDGAARRATACASMPLTCPSGDGARARGLASEIDASEIPPLDVARVASIVGASAGLAGVVAGVVLHLRAPSTARFTGSAGWRPVAAPGYAGLGYAF